MSIDPFEIADIQDETLRKKLNRTMGEYEHLEEDLEELKRRRKMKLNDKGQCPECKIKPLKYKTWRSTGKPPHYFCHRCDRSFDLETKDFIPNFHWAAPHEPRNRTQRKNIYA